MKSIPVRYAAGLTTSFEEVPKISVPPVFWMANQRHQPSGTPAAREVSALYFPIISHNPPASAKGTTFAIRDLEAHHAAAAPTVIVWRFPDTRWGDFLKVISQKVRMPSRPLYRGKLYIISSGKRIWSKFCRFNVSRFPHL